VQPTTRAACRPAVSAATAHGSPLLRPRAASAAARAARSAAVAALDASTAACASRNTDVMASNRTSPSPRARAVPAPRSVSPAGATTRPGGSKETAPCRLKPPARPEIHCVPMPSPSKSMGPTDRPLQRQLQTPSYPATRHSKPPLTAPNLPRACGQLPRQQPDLHHGQAPWRRPGRLPPAAAALTRPRPRSTAGPAAGRRRGVRRRTQQSPHPGTPPCHGHSPLPTAAAHRSWQCKGSAYEIHQEPAHLVAAHDQHEQPSEADGGQGSNGVFSGRHPGF